MCKKTKGQALIEFVLILPILLILTIGVFDLFNMQNQKYDLANDLDYVSLLYINNKNDEVSSYLNNKDIILTKVENDNYIEIKLTKKVKLITPLLNKILSNPYEISVTRYLYE